MDHNQGSQTSDKTGNQSRHILLPSYDYTYRVRRIPVAYSLEEVKAVLRTTLQLNNTCNLRIGSIAPDLEKAVYQVATISFRGQSRLLPKQDVKGGRLEQWTLGLRSLADDPDSDNSEETITVDTHFRDFTPLNVPQNNKNVIDLVAVCGLNGHAFGSFKERDGSFMWLRDGLPREQSLQNVRIISYGYNSSMAGSHSFQGLGDLASTFKNRLKGLRRHSKSVDQPIMLMGHSLGGLVIKEALIQMAESASDGDTRDENMLHAIYALLFFGVPSRGMETTSLMAMVKGQQNAAFVSTLGRNSDALAKQHRQFCEAFPFEDSVVFSFFETEESPTAKEIGDKWEMSGPREVLVDISSATQSRTPRESKPYFIQAINRSHSELVKYVLDDECYSLVRDKIVDITEKAVETIRKRFPNLANQVLTRQDSFGRVHAASTSQVAASLIPENPPEPPRVTVPQPNSSIRPGLAESHVIDAEQDEELSPQEVFLSALKIHGSVPSTRQSSARHTGTCEWFFKTDQYQNWTKNPQPQTLVIIAPTGRGKSILADYIVSKQQAENENHTIISYFCKDGQNTRQTAVVIIRCLLYDLLSRRKRLLQFVPQRALVIEGENAMTFQNLWEILINILRASDREGVVCVIDGLDECDEDSRKMLQEAIVRDILSADPTAKRVNARFIITSQPVKAALVLEQRSNHLRILPKDVNKDITQYVCAEIKMLRNVGSDVQELADDIEKAITQRAEGSFQWAKLVLKVLEEAPISRNSIMHVFEKVPTELKPTYQRCFQRIGARELPRTRKARKILTILLFASRPLTPEELAICMINNPSLYRTHSQIENEYDHSMAWEANVTCGSFLDVSDKLINISHQSARESLLSFTEDSSSGSSLIFNPEEGHRLMATICLSYLLLEDFQNATAEADDRATSASFPFLRYAESNWAVHLRNVEVLDGLEDIIQRFFARATFRAGPWKTVWPQMSEFFPRWEGYEDVALLHLMIRSGLLYLLDRCKLISQSASHDSTSSNQSSFLPLSRNEVASQVAVSRISAPPPLLTLSASFNDEDAQGNTALMRAMKSFDWEIIFWLILRKGADVNTMDNQGVTLAHLGAQADSSYFLSILILCKNVNVNRVDGYGSTPLYDALQLGCEEAAKILLTTRPTRDSRSRTPLHLIAASGSENLVQLALDVGSKLNQRTKDKKTALMIASEKGHYGIVKKLLEKEADPELADDQNMTALHHAASSGNCRIVEVLLKNDVLPNLTDKYSRTPLHIAAKNGFEDIVRCLLPHASDLNVPTSDGETVLHIAITQGHLNIVKQLVEQGVNINKVSNDGCTPFHFAVSLGNLSIAEFLATQKGALLDTVDIYNHTPLVTAADCGREEISRLLLRHNVNVEGPTASSTTNNKIITPLLRAASGGFLGIVKQLVDAGASVDKLWDNWTPTLCAADNNHPEVVNFLLDHGADPHCATETGWTLLHCAARDGHEVLVSRLLNLGVDASHRNTDGFTPVYYACLNGTVTILEKLLNAGGDVKLASTSGLTVLHAAIDCEHKKMVRRLLEMKVDVNATSDAVPVPLVYAAGKENFTILKMLLDNGASFQESPSKKWSPLHEAARQGLYRNVALLLDWKHKIDALDNQGWTPLLRAAEHGHMMVVKTLLRYGANIKAVTNDGNGFLHYAVLTRSVALVKIGIEKGADINGSGSDFDMPLWRAIDNGDWEIFYELFTKGARYQHDDVNRGIMLVQASQPGFERIVRHLLSKGFDPNTCDTYGNTALHLAAKGYFKSTVRILVEYGADLKAIDWYGRTAQYWARRRFNHGMSDSRHSVIVNELDLSHRRQRLEHSIRFCIERLLQSQTDVFYYGVLSRSLQFVGEFLNARIVGEQLMIEDERPRMKHLPSCNVCGPHEGIQGYRYSCTSCADIDLCSKCFDGSWNPALLGRGCHAHTFLCIPRPEWQSLPAGVVNKKGQTMLEWLRELRPPRSSGLQDPSTGTWQRVEQQMQSSPGFWDIVDVLYQISDDFKGDEVDDKASVSSTDSDDYDTDEDLGHFRADR